ncbi:MAG: hypothetical protein A3F12_00355 [Gammaproteobacteria bacterium RIFCSPHIGHO2_12_FULL_38_14]|nr:MAG: hypothetical protein A3F12_00355 [Gammaproteobacteria bacterium RIFCSPHIGHO2_12_FULL_38_14]
MRDFAAFAGFVVFWSGVFSGVNTAGAYGAYPTLNIMGGIFKNIITKNDLLSTTAASSAIGGFFTSIAVPCFSRCCGGESKTTSFKKTLLNHTKTMLLSDLFISFFAPFLAKIFKNDIGENYSRAFAAGMATFIGTGVLLLLLSLLILAYETFHPTQTNQEDRLRLSQGSTTPPPVTIQVLPAQPLSQSPRHSLS